MLTREGKVVAVAESRQNVKGLARAHFCHLRRTLADDLVNEGQGGFVIIADGDGAAQVFFRQPQVYELTAVCDGGGIALQHHFVYHIRQRFVADDGENALFHRNSFLQ